MSADRNGAGWRPPWPGPLVLLCGAGISMAPPANVPSWWGFNNAVLDALRNRFLAEHQPPVHARRAVERLGLERVGVEEFSQIVSDAFAGATWFDALAALDGEACNTNHHVIAELADRGSIRAVVTTNFDTLIERALDQAGVRYSRFDALSDRPPDPDTEAPDPSGSSKPGREPRAPVLVIKAHGTASKSESLVDLASQKRRGLPVPWLDLLERLFATSPVLVVGFSGVDLELGDDYFRLGAAASSTPWMRWLVRPGQQPHPKAQILLDHDPHRFASVTGDLPQAWTSFGVHDLPDGTGTPPARSTSSAAPPSRTSKQGAVDNHEERPNVDTVISAWLEHPMVDADTCGLALTRLLDHAGSHWAAQALRTSILTRVKRILASGVPLTAAARAGLQIGQLAIDEPDTRSESALRDLDLSDRALTAVLEHLPPKVQVRPDVVAEMSHNRANSAQNRAYLALRGGAPREALNHADHARSYFADMSGLRLLDHEASHQQIVGGAALCVRLR